MAFRQFDLQLFFFWHRLGAPGHEVHQSEHHQAGEKGLQVDYPRGKLENVLDFGADVAAEEVIVDVQDALHYVEVELGRDYD